MSESPVVPTEPVPTEPVPPVEPPPPVVPTVPPVTLPGEHIRAGSVNLMRFMKWQGRDEQVIAEIASMDCDVIGFQETTEEFEDDLAVRLPRNWIVVSDHVNCPAFARADKFQRVKHNGRSGITITMPTKPFVRNRYGSAALLKRMSDGLVFVFVTIHPSNNGESSHAANDRLLQAESCWQHLVDWGVTHFPILMVGDMNDKLMPPNGLPGVFKRKGLVDVLEKLGRKPRIDRAFVKGFRVINEHVNPVSDAVSDHDFSLFIVEPLESVDKDDPVAPKTALEILEDNYGKVREFKISSFETARKEGDPSRYVAIVQDWLGLEVTTVWSPTDQKALDAWRHAEFPTWLPQDYKGPVGPTSMKRLAEVAKLAGKKSYPVIP